MKKKIIQLPKGYLSYSQKELWKNDPKRYKQIYFDGRDELRVSNSGMDYGKIVATALETEKDTDDLLTDSAMLLLPKYDIRDEEISTEFRTKEGWISLIGRPDTLNSKSFDFREYKTGKTKWTQKKAQNHPQMRFYAMLIYLKFNKLLHDAYLDWIETETVIIEAEEGIINSFTKKEIRPTGRVESFRVTFTLTDILNEMAETARVAKEIEIAFASHVPDPRMAW